MIRSCRPGWGREGLGEGCVERERERERGVKGERGIGEVIRVDIGESIYGGGLYISFLGGACRLHERPAQQA